VNLAFNGVIIMKRNQFLCGVTVALVAAAVGGCAESGAESARQGRAATDSGAPFTGKELTVCRTANAHDDHRPPEGGKFEIVETVENSGVYALKITAGVWADGWKSLTLARSGTQVARIPHVLWTNKCKPGDNSKALPFTPTTDTIRLWGQTCLPDGKLDPVKGECNGSRKNFHEVIIYVHEPNSDKDLAHVMMHYCGRHELDQSNKVMCISPPDDLDEDPHPGHIHIQP
jgi:hypothetical protein